MLLTFRLDLRTPIDPKDLITFLEANHNLMIFADAEAKRPVRQLANEFGVEFEGAVIIKWYNANFQGYEVRDYSSSDSGANLNTIYSRNLFEPFTTTSKGIFSKSERSIAFSGVGQVLDQNNQYLFPILRAEPTTFSFNPEKNSGDISKISGEALTLVSGYQTRNNQRVSISGSLSMCSNDNIYLT